MSDSSALPIGTLLSDTFSFLKLHWKKLSFLSAGFFVVGAVVWIVGTYAVIGNAGIRLIADTGTKVQSLSQLQVQAKPDDQAVQAQITIEKAEAVNEMVQVLRVFVRGIPVFLVLALLSWWFSAAFFVGLYQFILKPAQPLKLLMKRSAGLALPFIGVNIWSFLCGVWPSAIAFAGAVLLINGSTSMGTSLEPLLFLLAFFAVIAGIVLLVVRMPRYFAAQVIFVSQKKSIHESVQSSFRASKGYWGKIMGNMIVAGLVVGVISYVVGLVLTPITALLLEHLVWLFLLQIVVRIPLQLFGLVFNTVFVVLLAQTILKNPRKA